MFIKFVWEKNVLFDKWCHSCKVKTLEDLKALILLEEFKKCLPDWIVYLNEQKMSSLTNAAILADEFILTHTSVFSSQNLFQEVHQSKKINWQNHGVKMSHLLFWKQTTAIAINATDLDT